MITYDEVSAPVCERTLRRLMWLHTMSLNNQEQRQNPDAADPREYRIDLTTQYVASFGGHFYEVTITLHSQKKSWYRQQEIAQDIPSETYRHAEYSEKSRYYQTSDRILPVLGKTICKTSARMSNAFQASTINYQLTKYIEQFIIDLMKQGAMAIEEDASRIENQIL